MKDLILEIGTMRNMMGLKNTTTSKILTETAIPKPLWLKLAKYVDELVLGGEKTFDDLAKNGLITKQELNWLKSNAAEISRKAKNIVDPSTITDDVLKKFKSLTSKIRGSELETLSKKGFNNWLKKNENIAKPIDLLIDRFNKLQDEYVTTGKLVSDPDGDEILEYLKNGGTWDGLFKATLEGEGYSDDLLVYGLEKFKKQTDIPEKVIVKKKGSMIGNLFSEQFTMIYDILNSGFGKFDASTAYKNALEKTETIINNFKPENISTSSQAKELIVGLKNDVKQAVTNDLPFDKVWEDIKSRFPGYSELFKKIETESDGDTFTSIQKLCDELDAVSKTEINTKTKSLIGNFAALRLKIKEWANWKKLGEPWKTLGKSGDNWFIKIFTTALNVIFKSKVSSVLFWENANSLKTILKKLSKGQLRDKGFMKNLLTTWLRLLINSKIVVPFLAFAIELGKQIDATFIGVGTYDFKDKNLWERSVEGAYEKWLGPFYGETKGFWDEVWSGLELVWPFGKGPTMELFIDVMDDGWEVVKRLFTSTDENEAKERNEEFENDLEKKVAQKVIDDVNNSLNNNPLFEKGYVEVTDQYYNRMKRHFTDPSVEESVKDVNQYTDEEFKKIKESLKLQLCPGLSKEEIESEKLNILDIINNKNYQKNDKLCSGIFLNNDNIFYKVFTDGEKHFYIDNDGSKKPLKGLVSSKLKTSENESLKDKPEITPTKEKQIDQQKPINTNRVNVEPKPQNKQTVTPTVTEPVTEPVIDRNKSKGGLKENVMIDLIKKIILEEEEEKTLKMKDWDEIFTFQKIDDKTPGKYTDVKIKMDSVMDRMPHWRKRYKKLCNELENCDDDGEDDSFVRAVIDTHPEVVRILFTKGLAHLTSSEEQEDLNEGLHSLLAIIRESKSVEVEVWSVYRHPSSPDKIWSLVKGDFKPKELESMDVKIQRSPGNTEEKKKDTLSELKKKESDAIELLSKDEKKGLSELPIKVKNKIKEKISKGWTTEEPPKELKRFYKEDNVNTIFADDITIYKLKPNESFFTFIQDKDLSNSIKRGFCRAIYYVEKEFDLPVEKMEKINDLLDGCKEKLDGKYGQNYL
jgi:hypothetical protein